MSDYDVLAYRRAQADAALKHLFIMLPIDAAMDVNNKVLALVGKLERENAELREDKARLESYIAKQMHDLQVENTGQAIETEKLKRKNVALRDALSRIATNLHEIENPWEKAYYDYGIATIALKITQEEERP